MVHLRHVWPPSLSTYFPHPSTLVHIYSHCTHYPAMYSNQGQLYQPQDPGPSRSTSLTIATGHPTRPHALVHQIHSINPLRTLKDPSKAHIRPSLYSSHQFPIQVPLSSSNPSSSTSTPSHPTATPSPVLSTRTPSTRHSSLQPLSTRPSPTQPSSNPLPRDGIRSILSKRARDYTPSPPTSYRASPAYPPHATLLSPQLHPTQSSSERPAKRLKPNAGRPNHKASKPPVFARPLSPGQHSIPSARLSKPTPKRKKVPLHPLAVDYGRPMRPVVPQPPFCRLSLRQNHIPLPPDPESPDSWRLLEDELRGPVDPAVARELGELMWMQQKRVWDDRGGYSDPFLGLPIPISRLDTRSSSSRGEVAPAQSREEAIALYGPPRRDNEFSHLGERLTNPSVVVLDDDENGGFGDVLDLYRSAVQGSTLSMELELAVGGDAELTGASWEAASSLEVGIKCTGSSVTSSVGGPSESRTYTLVEYKQVVEAEQERPSLKPAAPKEDPPLGIEWSYSSCGYTTGRVVNPRKACKPLHQRSIPSTSADQLYRP